MTYEKDRVFLEQILMMSQEESIIHHKQAVLKLVPELIIFPTNK